MTVEIPIHRSDFVDLRSDTVTKPPPEMYEAMLKADLGDDVLGDDPTVQKLEELAAEMAGKEAAVFVPSGTMGNQIAIASHTHPGDAILIEQEAHMLYYEVGAPAVLSGVVSWTIPSIRGAMNPADVEARVLKRNIHTPGTTLLCLENTHNRAGGAVIPLETMAAYRGIAERHGMQVHLDGARVFNAAVALAVPLVEIAQYVDSVNFCLSKGLRAPIGSVLCGETAFIERARIWRKRLGGGMRQAGLLAACGIVSLTKMVDRLEEDHRRARYVAQQIADLPGIAIDSETVQTNMVMVETDDLASRWQTRLAEQGVHCFLVGPNRLRLVFHAGIDDSMVDRTIQAFRKVAES